MLRIYTYSKCSTCRAALKWLERNATGFEEFPIREQPPARQDLSQMLAALESRGGSLRSIFNSSGRVYRALNLKKKLSTMSRDETLRLLSANGNLVKRPFAIDSRAGIFLVGFDEQEWTRALRSGK